MTMKATFERPMLSVYKGVIKNAAAMTTLAGAARYIQGWCPELWVYVGAAHIAIHRETGKGDKGKRLAIIEVDE